MGKLEGRAEGGRDLLGGKRFWDGGMDGRTNGMVATSFHG